jgi:hypothetical protein
MGNERDILLEHILAQIEKLNEKQDDMANKNAEDHLAMHYELVTYNSQLAEHMRRTAIAENRITVVENEIKPVVAKYQADTTVRRFFNTKFVKASKIVGLISVTACAIWGIIQIITYLNTL